MQQMSVKDDDRLPNKLVRAFSFGGKLDEQPQTHLFQDEKQRGWVLNQSQGSFSFSSNGITQSLQPFHHLALVFGLGDALFLKELIQHKQIKTVLVYEPSSSLVYDVWKTKIGQEVLQSSKVRLIVGNEEGSLLSAVESFFYEEIDHICRVGAYVSFVTPGADKIPNYQELFNKFNQAFQTGARNILIKSNHSVEDSFFGISHYLENIQSMRTVPDFSVLEGCCLNQTAVVVATGPSLKHAIQQLKSIQDHVLIVACDSAASILNQESIRVDVICSLERCVESFDIVSQDKEISSVYVAPTIVYPKTFSNYSGPKFFVGRDTGFDGWLRSETPRYFLGQTVSQMAIQMASVLGCKTIYTLGLDCAFDPETKSSHHDEAHQILKDGHEWVKTSRADHLIEVTGYDGQPKLTWPVWYLDTQAITRLVYENDLNLIRVSPLQYAFPIEGMNRSDPSVLLHLKNEPKRIKDFYQAIEKAYKDISSSNKLDDFDSELKAGEEYLIQLSDQCIDTLKHITDFYYFQRPHLVENYPRYHELFSHLKEIKESMIRDKDGYFGKILLNLLQGRYIHFGFSISQLNSKQLQEAEYIDEALKLYRDWFSEVLVMAQRILRLINQNSL